MSVRVLLAEDNEPLSRMLQNFLASMKLEVHAATSGTDVLKILLHKEIDILLLDLRLPGLSGVEVLQQLRKTSRWADLPIIIMTGVYTDERSVAAARKLGVRYYLRKPFTREVFLEAIQATLAEIRPTMKQSLAQLLVDIYQKQKNGLLTVAHGSPIAFVRGEPYSFLAKGKEDFPNFLLVRGLIDVADKKLFLDSGEERLFFNQAGLLTYEELVEESRLLMTKCLVDALETRGGAIFSEGVFAPELPLVPLSVPCLLYEAIKSHPARGDSDSFIREFSSRYPARTPLFYCLANLTIMRKEDIDLLGVIDGRHTLAEILATTPKPSAVSAFCHYLLILGMIVMQTGPVTEAAADFPQKYLLNRPIEEAESEEMSVGFDDLVDEISDSVEIAVGEDGMGAPLSADEIDFEQTVQRDHAFIRDKNYYEILGITPGSFSFNALKEAYFAKSRLYSPERFMELSGSTQNMAQEILAVFANAYNTLSSVVAKERYDEMHNSNRVGLAGKQDDKLQARIQFQSGKVFLEMGEFDNAEKSLQDAYTIEPENALHCAYLGWAIYRNPVNKNSRSAIEKARSLLSRSLQLDKNADAFSFRGWMLLDEGRDGLAEGEFQKAAKLNPNEIHARQGLRVISDKREAQNKGFFSKIFG